jgi:hypothetical protein
MRFMTICCMRQAIAHSYRLSEIYLPSHERNADSCEFDAEIMTPAGEFDEIRGAFLDSTPKQVLSLNQSLFGMRVAPDSL